MTQKKFLDIMNAPTKYPVQIDDKVKVRIADTTKTGIVFSTGLTGAVVMIDGKPVSVSYKELENQ